MKSLGFSLIILAAGALMGLNQPALAADMLTITCKAGHIQEARICLTRALDPRECGADVARDCTLPDALFAPLAALEYRLSLGRQFASSFHYEINTMTQQLIDELDWNRRHMDEIERLSQFDFETVSWKEPEAAEEL